MKLKVSKSKIPLSIVTFAHTKVFQEEPCTRKNAFSSKGEQSGWSLTDYHSKCSRHCLRLWKLGGGVTSLQSWRFEALHLSMRHWQWVDDLAMKGKSDYFYQTINWPHKNYRCNLFIIVVQRFLPMCCVKILWQKRWGASTVSYD